VVVVGHSLGAVVAYDMLNELLNADAIGGGQTHVAARTELLLTFGAPLDKTAYVFGTQSPSKYRVQDGLEAVVQPLIVDYANRPRRWFNIWSPNDWISGPLDYYDKDRWHPSDPITEASKRVANVVDEEASTPLLAHNEYWYNLTYVDRLYEAVTAPLPAAKP
jgi:hypothetical protein